MPRRTERREGADRGVPVSAPDDPREQAAERAAAAALAGTGPVASDTAPASRALRSPAVASPGTGVAPVPRDGGQALPPLVRTDLETRFGADLAQARVHVGPEADRAARSVDAAAFTVGSHMTFAAGRYAPETGAGRRLLAHEIAHVVQGDPGRVHRAALPFSSQMSIQRNVLRGQTTFPLNTGEGVVVETSPDWFDAEDSEDERAPVDRTAKGSPGGLTSELRVGLERIGTVWDSEKGRCTATIGAWNHVVLKTDEAGTYHLVFDVDDHNHNFLVGGPVHVRTASADELGQACGMPEGMSGLELLHYVLDAAGLVPALGIVPDGLNAVIYSAEGDWTSAGLSAAAMIPVLGEGATLVKWGDKAAVKLSKRAAAGLERRTIAAALRETKAALKSLRTPPVFAHPLNRIAKTADQKLIQLAREARITQAGITREAFQSFNVATARVRIGETIEYLTAGNSPGRMMHSEDWIVTQLAELKTANRGKTVVLEQLYSERIPCRECLQKLTDLTNTEMFYTVREHGSRAADLMRAYGL